MAAVAAATLGDAKCVGKTRRSLSSNATERQSLLLAEAKEMESVPEKTEMTSSTAEVVIRRQLYTQASLDDVYVDQSVPLTSCDVIKKNCRVTPKCVARHALNYFPIVRFVRGYQLRKWVLDDIISGLSVGFLHLPQGLGFGILASLLPVHGLYTSFFPTILYLLFGTSPYVSMGTNAVIALLTATLVNREADNFRSSLGVNETWTSEEELNYKVGIAAASCFVGGLILVGMGLLRLGFITNFMATSFIGGFTFSAAVHISTSQIVKMLNVKVKGHSGFGKLVKIYVDLFKNITDANPADIIIGVICMAVLLAVKIGINERYKHKMKIPVPIELIVVIVSTLISHFAKLHDRFGVGIVGEVPTGLPAPSLPDMDNLSSVFTDAFVTAILIFTLTISLAKLTAKLHSITIDNNQEMLAYGLCLLVGGFFQNFPSCTAPPRTMMLSSLGARSTLSGLSTALFLLLVLLVAGQLFEALPIAMLAAMIIVAMKDLLLQIRNLKPYWHINKADFFIWIMTAIFSVFGDLDIGLLVGVVFSMVTVMVVGQLAKGRLLGKASTEDLVLRLGRKGICSVPGVKIFRFESPLYFASQERFKSQLFSLVMNPASSSSLPSGTQGDTTVTVSPPSPPLLDSASNTETPLRSLREDPESSTSNDEPQGNPDTRFNGKKEEEEDYDDHVTRHVVLDCSAMTYIDVSGVDMLTSMMTQLSRAGVRVWLADVPAGTLGTLQRAGFVEKMGASARMVYSVMDALAALQKEEPCFVSTEEEEKEM